ncbi:MAG: hypothetical protein LBT91_00625, partial [Bifidobacteriaceae bacterium]|nr:hypothetical protein [Bifidobacteriaceae bacterium]
MTKQKSIVLIFLISVNFIFINLTQINLAAAQDLSGADQYRFSESGSFHNSRWVEADYYAQTPDGNIYFEVSPYKITDPETQICHLLYNQTEKCVDLSDQLDAILPNGSFEDITVDQNNNIYMTYTNLNYSAVAVFKINPSD